MSSTVLSHATYVELAKDYQGTVDESVVNLLDLLDEVFITFPTMLKAALWAETYHVADKVNIAFHGTYLSDEWTVRLVFPS